MTVAQTILEQLGGNKFRVMTGSSQFLDNDNTLCMTLAKNKSRANRLHITLNSKDLYIMRFFRYKAAAFNTKTLEWKEEVIEEIELYDGLYNDQLAPIFTEVTGLLTHL